MVKAALPASAHGKRIEIWFQDEARVGQKGTLARLWAKRGTRPRATRDTRYEWAYIFGAVCPERSTGAALVMPYADGAALNAHLREIACHVAPDAHAVLLFDGAGWHISQELQIPSNITPIKFPPYAPELNPVENGWDYLRKNKLSNRLYDDYEALVAACCQAWNDLIATPERIASITRRDWAVVS